MEYIGEVSEMGDFCDDTRGIIISLRPNVDLQLTGFTRLDMQEMPNFLYKKVKISVELIDE